MQMNDFKCCICLEKLKEPITLCSNYHNFCLKCVNEYFNVRRGNSVNCPLCRESVDLSKGIELKKNPYLENLVKFVEKNEKRFKKQAKELKQKQEERKDIIGVPKKRKEENKFQSRFLKTATTEEFDRISKFLLDHFEQNDERNGKVFQVVVQEVKKFCNPTLALRFHKEKDKMMKRMPKKSSSSLNIEMMTHGTDLGGVIGISKKGFRLPTSNVRKDDNEPYMFGKACYFSPLTNKCTQYGKDYLIVSDLLLGKVYRTKEFKYSMELKKLKELGNYNSIHCGGDTQHRGGVKYEEVAIYKTEQILPLFAIRYKLVENKFSDLESFKLTKEYTDENEKFKSFFEENENVIQTLTNDLRSSIPSKVESTVKLIGDLSKYKASRFRLWYEVSLSEEIYAALRDTFLQSSNELTSWECMRAIWGLTYGNINGQTKFLTFGGVEKGKRFIRKVVENLKNHPNRTIKQRSAVLICNFSQQKANREIIEPFGTTKLLLTILKDETKQRRKRLDLKLIVNVIAALGNFALDYYRKFSNNDKFFLESLLNNQKLKNIHEEVLRCICNLMFEGSVSKEWVNKDNKYVSEKSSEFF